MPNRTTNPPKNPIKRPVPRGFHASPCWVNVNALPAKTKIVLPQINGVGLKYAHAEITIMRRRGEKPTNPPIIIWIADERLSSVLVWLVSKTYFVDWSTISGFVSSCCSVNHSVSSSFTVTTSNVPWFSCTISELSFWKKFITPQAIRAIRSNRIGKQRRSSNEPIAIHFPTGVFLFTVSW